MLFRSINGDLWVDTNDGNRLYILVNGVWSNIQDEAIQSSFAAAASAACIADSKIATYYCNEPPTTDINDHDFLWIYWNRDGSLVEMCVNGSRCITYHFMENHKCKFYKFL